MYFLEFEELNGLSKYEIIPPFRVAVNLHTDENSDYLDWELVEGLVNGAIEDLLSPLISFINNDDDMTLGRTELDMEDTYAFVQCNEDKINTCIQKLTEECQKLDGSEEEADDTFELDRDAPYEDAWDYSTETHYTRDIHLDDDEWYEYTHSKVSVEVEFIYDKDLLEYYKI